MNATVLDLQVIGDLSPEVSHHGTPALEHRENCLCLKAARERPAVMFDERRVATSLLDGVILDTLDKELTEPMVRTYTRRYNEAGDPIGPDLAIRCCDALLFYRVLNRIFGTIERGAERQR